jgi:uncharacterized protein YndB with AHSA1/START domain
MAAATPVAEKKEHELWLTCVLDAPRELVFKAWTHPKHVAQWWGPNGFTSPLCEVDARAGGAIRIDMRGPDGRVYPMMGTFTEVIEPERIVFTSGALDGDGKALFEIENTVTLEKQGTKTKQTLRARVLSRTAGAAPYLAGMDIGWTQSLERLAEYVAAEAKEQHR